MKEKNGFTLIELLFVLGITAIISVIFIKLIITGSTFLKIGQDELQSRSQAQQLHPVLNNRLSTAKTLHDVSLVNDLDAFIDYTDQNNTRVKIFYNSEDNQSNFLATNRFSESSIVAIFEEDGDISDPELLLNKVSSFNIQTFKQDPNYFRVVSPNNMTSPNLEEVNSLKISYAKQLHSQKTHIEYLVSFYKTELEKNGTKSFGTDDVPFTNQVGFEYSNIDIQVSDEGGDDDGLRLTTEIKTVKIQNTGEYYDTIMEAVNASNYGDTILVAAKEGGYEESVFLKSGLRIIGGYNPQDWTRNPELHLTQIKPLTGLSNTTFFANQVSDIVIDGFVIDGLFFQSGINCQDSNDVLIKNCKIENVERGVQFVRAKGIIENISVTANEHSVFIYDSDNGVTIQRSRLHSTNEVQEENVRLFGSQKVTVKNNIISGGYNSFTAEQTINSYIYNNIINDADNFGIHVKESTNLEIYNNVISNHTLGILLEFVSPPVDPQILVKNNLFVNNSFLAILGMGLDPANENQETQIGNLTWTSSNPYFFDIINFQPKGNAATSILIDKGTNVAAFQDRARPDNGLAADVPSIEGIRNDIGAYGGPTAGRVGHTLVTKLDPEDSLGTWEDAIAAAYPGDIIIFQKGTYTITDTIILKSQVSIYGEGHSKTVIKNGGSSSMFQLNGSNRIADLEINGDDDAGIEVRSLVPSNLQNVVIYNCSTGLSLDDGACEVYFSVFDSNTNDITIGGSSRASINYTILSNSDLGINNIGGVQAFGQHNIFYANDTYFNGNYASNNDVFKSSSELVFWDRLGQIYQLHPSADIINKINNIDPGVEEYFELIGQVKTSTLSSDLFRAYNEITLNLGGRADLEAEISSVEVALLSGELVVTLSEPILISKNVEHSLKLALPVTSIAKDIAIRIKVTSYTVNHSPYINDIRITW
ncbi:hypothetical protein DID80_06200 [Candidatus Marinamargulisbacteria bacterium SCGC AAA071-K20]|nr:hypothetical protein DID80_06200 [Candidatus Marinamargulisbacteria bacterium SCGC AAA071-K20]